MLGGTLLAATLLLASETGCGDGSFDCCECTFMGPDCSGHFGPQKFPNGITRSACAMVCASQSNCPVADVSVSNGCLD